MARLVTVAGGVVSCGIVVAEPEGRQTRYEVADPHLARALTALVDVTLAVDESVPCMDPDCVFVSAGSCNLLDQCESALALLLPVALVDLCTVLSGSGAHQEARTHCEQAMSLYDAAGGLDEENFAVAYNDVDFCLRLRQAG